MFDRTDLLVVFCSFIFLAVIAISIPLIATDVNIEDIEHYYNIIE